MSLRGVRCYGHKVVAYWYAGDIGYAGGNLYALIVATAKLLLPVHRYRKKQVDRGEGIATVGNKFACKFPSEFTGESRTVGILGVADKARKRPCGVVAKPYGRETGRSRSVRQRIGQSPCHYIGRSEPWKSYPARRAHCFLTLEHGVSACRA